MKMIEDGRTPAIHGVVRWRIVDLCQWVFEEFRIAIAEQTMSRELRKMGLRKLSARPRHHAQAEDAIKNFKKVSRPAWRNSRAKKVLSPDKIEIWFQDEARVGQKNKITRCWAKRGSRPCAPKDQPTSSTYIFGAICPKEGKGAGLVLPVCDTYAMNLHLAEIASCTLLNSRGTKPRFERSIGVRQGTEHKSWYSLDFVPATIACAPEALPWGYARRNLIPRRLSCSGDCC